MGFFDGGIFGDMFDLNGDGRLDVTEQALEFCFLEELIKSDEDEDL